MAIKPRQIRKDEVLALETVLAYSNLYAEKEHWMEMGGPDRHIWNEFKTLLGLLTDAYPDTSLKEPEIKNKRLKQVPVSPHDTAIIFHKE